MARLTDRAGVPRTGALVATAAIVAALAAPVALAGCAGDDASSPAAPTEFPDVPVTVDDPAAAVAEAMAAPASTPRELWRKGMMPYLYQIDPQWSETPYSNGTLAKQGCGPTALSMVYIYLTGDTSLDPAAMASFSTENGYSTDLDGSSWSLMTEGAAKLGLTGTALSPTTDAVRAELEAGRPVICVMSPGTFTEVGHYIVLGRMALDGGVVVHDSNSVGRSMRTWSLDLVCSEAAGAWSFSAA